MKPERIQLSRRKGWRKPENTVVVARPSKWGNPFAAQIPHGETLQPRETRAYLVAMFHRWITSGERFDEIVDAMPLVDEQGRAWKMHSRHTTRPTPREIRAELAGKNLACWCPLDQPCHADVLLEIANS
jgi:hypothetical protein